MKVKIQLSDSQVDKLVNSDLSKTLANLKNDLQKVKSSKKGFVFSRDARVDELMLSKHIKAFETVLKFYSVPTPKPKDE